MVIIGPASAFELSSNEVKANGKVSDHVVRVFNHATRVSDHVDRGLAARGKPDSAGAEAQTDLVVCFLFPILRQRLRAISGISPNPDSNMT